MGFAPISAVTSLFVISKRNQPSYNPYNPVGIPNGGFNNIRGLK